MLLSHTVKDTILFPVIYVIVFVSVLLVLCVFNIIHTVGVRASLLPVFSQDFVSILIPHAVSVMFLLALFFTNFFILIRLQRKPGIRFLSFIVITACCFILFLCGYSYIQSNVTQASPAAAATPAELDESQPARKLYNFRNGVLYFEVRQGNRVQNIVVVNNSPATPDITRYTAGSLSVSRGSVVLNTEGPSADHFDFQPSEGTSSLFLADSVIAGLISNYQKLESILGQLYLTRRAEFYLFSLSLFFVILAAGFFMRLSRWALFNAFFYLFAVMLIFLFNNFIMYTVIPELKKIIGQSVILSIIPSVILLILGVTFFLLDFLLLPQPGYGRKRFSV
jgi:hypothetical protein